MVKYYKFESEILSEYIRGLIEFQDVLGQLAGYLRCMSDLGVIEQDRATEEMQMVTKRLLNATERRYKIKWLRTVTESYREK